ncbi:MAG: outer membrane beta-barrel protein [Bacteroidota bacterium]
MKNLTKILMIALFSIIVSGAFAQNGGFKFGLNMANANQKVGDEKLDIENQLLFAPRLGFIFEMPVHENIFMQTGIFGTASGYSYDSQRDVDDDILEVEWADSREKYVLVYFELPVNFGYKHELNDDVSLFGMMGPVFRYMPYSTLAYKIDGEWDNEVTHFGEGDNKIEFFNKFDMGLNIEAGAQVDRYQFTLFYSPSFTNIVNEEADMLDLGMKWKNYSFGLNIAILFGDVSGGGSGYRR